MSKYTCKDLFAEFNIDRNKPKEDPTQRGPWRKAKLATHPDKVAASKECGYGDATDTPECAQHKWLMGEKFSDLNNCYEDRAEPKFRPQPQPTAPKPPGGGGGDANSESFKKHRERERREANERARKEREQRWGKPNQENPFDWFFSGRSGDGAGGAGSSGGAGGSSGADYSTGGAGSSSGAGYSSGRGYYDEDDDPPTAPARKSLEVTVTNKAQIVTFLYYALLGVAVMSSTSDVKIWQSALPLSLMDMSTTCTKEARSLGIDVDVNPGNCWNDDYIQAKIDRIKKQNPYTWRRMSKQEAKEKEQTLKDVVKYVEFPLMYLLQMSQIDLLKKFVTWLYRMFTNKELRLFMRPIKRPPPPKASNSKKLAPQRLSQRKVSQRRKAARQSRRR